MSKKNWRKIIVDDVEYHWSVQYGYEYNFIIINKDKKQWKRVSIDYSNHQITPSFIRWCILNTFDDYQANELLETWNEKRLRLKKLKRIIEE